MNKPALKYLKLLFSLRIKVEKKNYALFGKIIPISYLLNPNNPKIDLGKVSNILYLNYNKSLKKDDVITQDKIYSTVNKFLFSISFNKIRICYVTYNVEKKKYDILINTSYFSEF